MIPTELITMGASFIGSAVLTLFKQSMEKRQALFEMAMAKSELQQKIYQEARNAGSNGFQITRRVIALGVIGAIVFATLLAPYWIQNVPIHIGLPETTSGFWFLTDPKEVIKWYSFENGIVVGPLFTHMASAITGFFFGNQVVKG
jgi:hypothetical protein